MVVSGALSTLLDTFRAAGSHTGSVGTVDGMLQEIDQANSRAPREGTLVGLIDAQWSVFQQSTPHPGTLDDALTHMPRGRSLDLQA